jgi:hypothetical protein
LIANILNGEGYSKLKAIVKENIKAVISENKELISVSFAAIIQTLRTDPQMANLIYSIHINANNGEQHKDNNISKYLEFNKDRLSDLADKNYQNLVEALTNNAIANIANASSFNSTLSLPQASSTFLSLSNQSDTIRIEDSNNYHNRRDIAE